jgi:tRNA (guanine37-N1)-methyltransferase
MAGPRIDIVTIFPELVEHFLKGSLLGLARRDGIVEVRTTDLRAYATDRQRSVDDEPFGGGDGMVLKCEPVVAAVEALAAPGARIFCLGPRGRIFDQALAEELVEAPQLVLLCGRYAGFDERICEETGAEELSLGDYVISGGEAAALVVTEAVTRLVPGVVGNPASPRADSFSEGLLEHPIYTRPREFRGRRVPEPLLSGNHAQIERFRREESLRLTRERRPELLEVAQLSDEDRKFLEELER